MKDPLRWLFEQDNFTVAFIGILSFSAGIYFLVGLIIIILMSLIAR